MALFFLFLTDHDRPYHFSALPDKSENLTQRSVCRSVAAIVLAKKYSYCQVLLLLNVGSANEEESSTMSAYDSNKEDLSANLLGGGI